MPTLRTDPGHEEAARSAPRDFDPMCTGDPEDGFRLPVRLEPGPRGPLPLGIRITIFLLGWVLILIGVAGLVLPGIQGILTIIVGAAMLSLDNDIVYRGLRRTLRRWPGLWNKIEHYRERAHRKLDRFRLRHRHK